MKVSLRVWGPADIVNRNDAHERLRTFGDAIVADMDSSLLTDSRSLLRWFNAGHDEARRDLAEMLAGSRESWADWITQRPEALTYQFALAVLERSAEARDRDPSEAVALTAFLIDVAPSLSVPVPEADQMLRARIWIEHGNALLLTDDLSGALDAFERAAAMPAAAALPLSAALARRGAAYTRHRRGDDSDEPLRIIRSDIPLFEAHGSAGDVLRSRFLEAAIHYERGQYKAAKKAFEILLRAAEKQRDERMAARLVNNLGHCERQLGHGREAAQYLVAALHRFERLGMSAERFRPLWGIELLRADEGAATEAVAALRGLMQPLVESGRTIEAALVALDVVELLVLSERQQHVRRMASELLKVFEGARMQRETMRAFAALRAAADARDLTVRDVRAAAADLRGIAG